MKVDVINPLTFEMQAQVEFEEAGLLAYKKSGISFDDTYMYVVLPAFVVGTLIKGMSKEAKKFYKNMMKDCDSPVELYPFMLGKIVKDTEEVELVLN